MYRSPSPDGGDKPKTKADATAVSRSSIRRQPVRQFGIFRTSYAGLPRFNPRSDSPEDAEDRDDLFEWRPSPGSSHDLPQPTFAPRSGALNDIRREMGERLLRESLGRARPGNWLAAQNTSRATPDSPTGPEIQRSWRAPPTPDETRDSSHRQPDGPVLAQSPSPVPQDSTGIASGSYPPGHDDGWPELEPSPEDLPTTTGAFSSWTDGFAPAHPVDRTDALREPSPEAMAHASLPDWYVAESAEVSRPSADLLDSLPPLRRVGHRQVSNANLRSNVDGLGDRQRSPSDEGETDLWESMFTTVIPDQNLPSADSSFTSTASRVLSGNTSRSSRTTINTPTTSFSERPGDVSFGTSAPRRRTPHRPGSPGCDIPEGASDTEPERFTDDTPRARRRVVRPISHRQSPVDGGTSRRSADSNGNRRNPRTESDHDLLRFIRTNGVLRAGTSTHYPHTCKPCPKNHLSRIDLLTHSP